MVDQLWYYDGIFSSSGSGSSIGSGYEYEYDDKPECVGTPLVYGYVLNNL